MTPRPSKRRGVGKRRRAREMAVQMLYQHELGATPVAQIFESFDLDDYLTETDADEQTPTSPPGPTRPEPTRPEPARRSQVRESFRYAQKLVRGTLADGDTIDAVIRRHAENWRLERMPPIDRNILRLALYEMLREESVPKVVIVDEAIELAKKFGSESSGRFVNGLLDGVLKSKALETATTAATEEDGEA